MCMYYIIVTQQFSPYLNIQDFDIAGNYGTMLPDAECLEMMCEILDQTKVGKYVIKVCTKWQ